MLVRNSMIVPNGFPWYHLDIDGYPPGLLFDIGLFFILIHYVWKLGKIPAVKEHTYLLVAGNIFAVGAIAHLLRLFTYSIAIVILG